MRAEGFEGFERGERGSTAEHLEVLDYKIQQDTIRAETAKAIADSKENEVAALNTQMNVLHRQVKQDAARADAAAADADKKAKRVAVKADRRSFYWHSKARLSFMLFRG